MARQERDYLPRRINQYTPNCQYAADVVHGSSVHKAYLGNPAAGTQTDIATAQDLSTTGTTVTFSSNNESDAKFGRAVVVTGTGTSTGGGTGVVKGRDYLGQPMSETLTFTSSAGGAVATTDKAFYWVESFENGSSALVADIDFGWSDKLGLPYKAVKDIAETSKNRSTQALTEQSLGTLVIGDQVYPATATTGDPRGTYDPTVTLATGTDVYLDYIISADSELVTTGGNDVRVGGLYGVPHYYPTS